MSAFITFLQELSAGSRFSSSLNEMQITIPRVTVVKTSHE